MMRGALLYTLVTAIAALVAALVGGERAWAGASLAFLVQVATFWVLFVWLFPHRKMLAHGLGVLGRFVVFGAVALVAVPLLGLTPAHTLFALVAVFFVSTVFEPLFLQTDPSTRR